MRGGIRHVPATLCSPDRDRQTTTVTTAVTQARLWLVESTRVGLASALTILGVSAPDVMERLDADDADADAAGA